MKLPHDIRFWILLFFIVRLYHVANPPLEVAHNWRQTTVTMVARNFVESGPDLLHPKIDIAGEKSGITGMEFPVLNYLIYLLSSVFGYTHWYGRLINLVVSSLGLYYFYLLVKKHFNPAIAFNATFILLFSIWFSYSRKIMPDTFSVSLVIAGLFFGTRYVSETHKLKDAVLFFFLISLGTLSKLPAGYLLIVLSFFILSEHYRFREKIIVLMLLIVFATIISLYYFYWVPRLNATYGFNHFFMGKDITKGFADIVSHWKEAAEKFYAQAVGYSGFVVFLWSLYTVIMKKEKRIALVFVLCGLGFLLIMFKGGFAFYHHSYYIIPFAPVMALVMGYSISTMKSPRSQMIVLLVVSLECIFTNNADFYIKEKNLAILGLERDLDKISSRSDLVLINSGNVPTPMYFAHRKGWVEQNNIIANSTYIDSLKLKGLRVIVIMKKTFGKDLQLNYTKVFQDENYSIYKP